jgi:hypothetical protein
MPRFTRDGWNRQPSGNVVVSPEWRSRLASLWYANAGKDIVRGNSLTINGSGGTLYGGYLSTPGNTALANYCDLGTVATPADLTRVSALVIATPTTLASRNTLFGWVDAGAARYLTFSEGYTDASKSFCYNGADYTGELGPAGFFTANQRAVYGLSYNKNTNVVTAYKNGVGYAGSFNNASNLNYSAAPLSIGGRADGSGVYGWNGTIELLALFPFELSPAEFATLATNPWRLLAPVKRFWAVPATGSSAGATLTGQAATIAYGTIAINAGATLTGQAATTAYGTLTPSTGTNAGATLTGQAATTAYGTIAINAGATLTGQAATTAFGTIAINAGATLTGQAATVAQGSPAVTLSVQPTGQAATAAQGALGLAAALVGQSAVSAQGAFGVGLAVALSGQATAVVQGALIVGGDRTAGLLGLSSTIAQGSLSPSASVSLVLAGMAATTAYGALAPALAKGLSGNAATSAFGSLAPSVSATQILAGIQATVARGTLTPVSTGSMTAALTGLGITVRYGSLILTSTTVDALKNPLFVNTTVDDLVV